jgi:orotate phosphoribosyltransferase
MKSNYFIGCCGPERRCAGLSAGDAAGKKEGSLVDDIKRELVDALCRKSFKYSPTPAFKLVSGRMSRFYVNCKPVTLSARGMFLVGHLVFDIIKDCGADGVGGLTFGADPIAVATAFTSELQKQPIAAFSIRKKQKDHGIVKWMEGDLNPGARVVIIDDVATTGGSTIKAIERARAEGMTVAKAVILVDRQEGGLANIARHVSDAVAVVTRDELLQEYARQTRQSSGD